MALNLTKKKKGQKCDWCTTKVEKTYATSKAEQICDSCKNGNAPIKR